MFYGFTWKKQILLQEMVGALAPPLPPPGSPFPTALEYNLLFFSFFELLTFYYKENCAAIYIRPNLIKTQSNTSPRA